MADLRLSQSADNPASGVTGGTIGMATPQTAPAAAPEKTYRPGIDTPTFKDDPLAAIGMIVHDFGAGYGGRQTMQDKFRGRQKEERDIEFRQQEFEQRRVTLAINGFNEIVKMSDKVPQEKRTDFIKGSIANFLGKGKLADPDTIDAMVNLAEKSDLGDTVRSGDVQIVSVPTEGGTKILAINKMDPSKTKELFSFTKGVAPEIKTFTDKDGNFTAVSINSRTGEVISRNVLGQAAVKPEEAITLRYPDGQERAFRKGDKRVDAAMEEGAVPVTKSIQGTPGEFDPTKPEFKDLRDAQIGTEQAKASIEEIKNLVKGKPEIMSVAGGLSSLATHVVSQAEGLAKLTGIKIEASQDAASYKEELGKLGIAGKDSAVLESAIVNLAYSAAVASGQSGRSVSDRDVARFIKEIGGGLGSPDQFIGVLDAFQKRMDRNLEIRRNVLTRKPGQAVKPIEPSDDNPLGLRLPQ
jgi:hypothetical protein